MVRPERFELPTYCSGGNRSIQLSYGRAVPVYISELGPSISRGKMDRGHPRTLARSCLSQSTDASDRSESPDSLNRSALADGVPRTSNDLCPRRHRRRGRLDLRDLCHRHRHAPPWDGLR